MTVTREHADGQCCVDCLMLLANGETDPDWDEAETAEYLARLEARGVTGENVTIACDEDCEGWFSWSPCDVCGSTLGGDRHPVVFWY